MSKVILHIGTHKSATTTIQNTFAANAAVLRDNGLIYPVFHRGTGHHGLVYSWRSMPKFYALEGGGQVGLRWLAREFGAGPLPVFLSSEEFSRGDPNEACDFEEVRALLEGFAEVEVFLCLRPQWEFLQSAYLEISKLRQPPAPDQLAEMAIQTGMFAGLHADYNRLLDRLETAFRSEEITLLTFEEAVGAPGGILGWMLAHLGLPLQAEDLAPVDGGASNVSIGPLVGWAANALSAPRIARPQQQQMLRASFEARFAGRRCTLFSEAEMERLCGHFDPLNARVAARRQPYQPGFAIPPMRPPEGVLYRDDPAVQAWYAGAQPEQKAAG